MKAVIHVNNARHQQEHAAYMRAGLTRHGVTVEFAAREQPGDGDIAVIWGWRQRAVIDDCRRRGVPVLVMERGHIQPRMEWTSCGWNGLGNRAVYPKATDGGARWELHFGHLMRPWRTIGGYALICGQVRGDAALWGVDFTAWAQNATRELLLKGYRVFYRLHPLSLRNDDRYCPEGAHFSECPLAEDLHGAAIVVTYNSTAGVEGVLGGVATVTCDEGAMAWPVTSHVVGAPPVRPDRTQWAHDLAWTQWTPDEIANGTAWEALRACMAS